MKHKLSISVDDATVQHIRQFLVDGRFRNISHAVEYSVNHMFSEVQDETK
jgi:Arc/MetJ-type ribon-helix-helix transcriptional regulator